MTTIWACGVCEYNSEECPEIKGKTITLIRGHNYEDGKHPVPVNNGFDWINENTHPYEYDRECNTWKFYEISNGLMLNCYPENLFNNKDFVRYLDTL